MLRIGLLGASRIAPKAVIAPARQIDGVEVAMVAASDPDRARAYADEHDIPQVAPGYAALLESAEVDLVYNALPPVGHLEWSVAALQAGKHVLCEKPFAMNAAEARTMADAASASGLTLIEAFHYRFHPLFRRLLELLASDSVGAISEVSARFAVAIPYRAGELRHAAELGGGALMDLGCYPVHWVRTVMHAEPTVAAANAHQERPGVDIEMRATLEFPGGVPAVVSCSMDPGLQGGHRASLTVVGDRGSIEVDNPLSPHNGHNLRLTTGNESTEQQFDLRSTYYYQMLHLLAVVAGDEAPLTGGEDAVANMQLIDEIYRSSGMQPRGETTISRA